MKDHQVSANGRGTGDARSVGGRGPYRKVNPCMWGDAKFRALSAAPPNAQTLWLLLLTGEHTDQVPGLARAGEAQLAEALGWAVEPFRSCWLEIAEQGMAAADWNARVVWLPNAVRYNPPENPNVVKSWARAWAAIPECGLKERAREALECHMRERGQAFLEAFHQACPAPVGAPGASPKHSRKPFRKRSPEGSQERPPEPSPNQEQEQEHEHRLLARARERGNSTGQGEVLAASSTPPQVTTEPDPAPRLLVVDLRDLLDETAARVRGRVEAVHGRVPRIARAGEETRVAEVFTARVRELGEERAVEVCVAAAEHGAALARRRGEEAWRVESLSYFLGPLADAADGVEHQGPGAPAVAPVRDETGAKLDAYLRASIREDLYLRWFASCGARLVDDELQVVAPDESHRASVEESYGPWLTEVVEHRKLAASVRVVLGEPLRCARTAAP